MADKSYISHLRDFIALTGSSNALKEHDNISPDHSLHYFPMKLDKTFKNFIDNFYSCEKSIDTSCIYYKLAEASCMERTKD